MQRLFSTFANGGPGKGLLLLRLALSTFLFYDTVVRLQQPFDLTSAIPQLCSAAMALLLLIGLWTPVAGVLGALLQIWIAVFDIGDLGARLLAAAVALGLSLIGPGAWSVDALVFGRRRISIQDR